MSAFDWPARLEALVRAHAPSAREQRAFVAWSLVRAIREARPASLTPDALKLLGELTKEAGVAPGEPPAVLLEKLDAHLAAHAPPAAMVQAFEHLMREATLAGQGAQAGAAFAQFVGSAATGVLGGGERPKGTTPGGPLAQLAFKNKK